MSLLNLLKTFLGTWENVDKIILKRVGDTTRENAYNVGRAIRKVIFGGDNSGRHSRHSTAMELLVTIFINQHPHFVEASPPLKKESGWCWSTHWSGCNENGGRCDGAKDSITHNRWRVLE